MEPNEKNTEENLDENQNHPQEHEKHIDDFTKEKIEGDEVLGGIGVVMGNFGDKGFSGGNNGGNGGA